MIEYRQTPSAGDAGSAFGLARELALSPQIAELLCRRGCDTPEAAREFLNPSIERLHDPFLFNGMQDAVDCIFAALANDELFCVYGDYDVDGVMAVTILVRQLKSMGARVVPYIPSRHTEGYGLNTAAVESLAKQGVTTLITVDCGITALKEIARAYELGMEVVVDRPPPVPARAAGVRGRDRSGRPCRALPLQKPLRRGRGLQAGARPGRPGSRAALHRLRGHCDVGRHRSPHRREPRDRSGGPAAHQRRALPGRGARYDRSRGLLGPPDRGRDRQLFHCTAHQRGRPHRFGTDCAGPFFDRRLENGAAAGGGAGCRKQTPPSHRSADLCRRAPKNRRRRSRCGARQRHSARGRGVEPRRHRHRRFPPGGALRQAGHPLYRGRRGVRGLGAVGQGGAPFSGAQLHAGIV